MMPSVRRCASVVPVPLSRGDLALGAGAALLTVADLLLVERPADGVLVTAVAGTLLGAAVAFRRAAPLHVAVGVAVVVVAQGLAGGRLTHMLTSALVTIGVVFSAALNLPRRRALAAAGAVLLGSWLDLAAERSTDYPLVSDLVFIAVLVCGAPLLAGQALREHREQNARLSALAAQLAVEREQLAQLAVADERTRIAREMHDVVAHSVSLMVVQAGAARRILDTRPERSRGAMLAVEDAGRQALAELRRIIGLLREDPPGEGLAPMPALAELPQLVESTRASGLDVELYVTGGQRPLPPGVDLAVYRVVQEALTNTVKHAGARRARVALDWQADALALEVVDDGVGGPLPAQPTGLGLVGMRERVAVCGGELAVGPQPGGFAVRVRVPLEPVAGP